MGHAHSRKPSPDGRLTMGKGAGAMMAPMTLVTALSNLYAASGIATCLCYGPQLIRLARSAEARRAMSLASWGGWLIMGTIALLYAAVVVGQPAMVLVSGLNAACLAVVVALVLGQRLADHQPRKTKRPEPHVGPTFG